ncbi:hypothetical protein [Methylocystis bryophila]|uniref:hypothetical protein n=1 Tax=Methylocystis bryophila TaxID=655015 RepID=UPI00131A0CC8|nr:hypothetical protein [Methylocystis bryophila]BDV38888.1 hypothetical protein DSM21852_21410 [Methylocystis bryophila]
MHKKIASGSTIAVAVAALLMAGATPAAARKPYPANKAKAPESSQKHRCNANGCPTK